jgi:hypothetical protein
MLSPATYIQIVETCQQINSLTGQLHGRLSQLNPQTLFDTSNYRPVYFKLLEVAPQKVIDSLGEERTWQQLDSRLLWTLDAMREHFGKKIRVNIPGYPNRGLRSHEDSNIEWSQHSAGRAADFTVDGLTDDDVRARILLGQKTVPAFRFITAIEANTTGWTHIDIRNTSADIIIIFSEK